MIVVDAMPVKLLCYRACTFQSWGSHCEIKWPGEASFMAWCARPDDVIYGKFLAWDEGRSRKHETDIYDILVFQYLEADPTLADTFDEAYLDAQAQALGADVAELWQSIKQAAQDEARREDTQNPVAS